VTGDDEGDGADRVLVAVNGGLMRGLKANGRMLAAHARFVRDATTAPKYRLWSIDDVYPAMLRANDGGGGPIEIEVWEVTPEGLLQIFRGEPPELSLGWITIEDGSHVLGVLGESAIVVGMREITEFGNWRAYIRAEGIDG